MGWKYEDLRESGLDPHELTCRCGHKGEDHHVVYWPLGMTLDECEWYGSNELGGMRPTWRARLFNRVLPPADWVYDHDADGKAILPGHPGKPTRLRNLVRRVVRGPLYRDHCHGFKEE